MAKAPTPEIQELIQKAVARTLGPGVQSIDEKDAVRVATTVVTDLMAEQASQERLREERRKRIDAAIAAIDRINVSIPRIAPGDVSAARAEINRMSAAHTSAVAGHEARMRANVARFLGLAGTIGSAVATGGSSAVIAGAITELAALIMDYVNGGGEEQKQ